MKKRNYINTKNNLIYMKNRILSLLVILFTVCSLNIQAQEGCLNICPDDTEKQISVSGETSDVVNGVVCIDNLTGDNFVIQNGDILSTLPQAVYSCYTVAISNASGEGFNIASTTYTIGNIQSEFAY